MAFKLNIFNTLKELEAVNTEKAALIAQVAELETELNATQDSIEKYMTEQKSFDTSMESLKTEHATKVEAVTKQFQSEVEALKLQLSKEQSSTNAKAANLLASIGVPEAELPKVSVSEQSPKGYTVISHLKPKI